MGKEVFSVNVEIKVLSCLIRDKIQDFIERAKEHNITIDEVRITQDYAMSPSGRYLTGVNVEAIIK